MNRRFKADLSSDQGHTWSKARASGWAISDTKSLEMADDYGYVIALTSGDTMIDVLIPEKTLRLMAKDVDKLRVSDEEYRRTKGIPINDSDSGEENQPV